MALEPIEQRVSRLAQSVSDFKGLLHVDCLLVSLSACLYVLLYLPLLPYVSCHLDE